LGSEVLEVRVRILDEGFVGEDVDRVEVRHGASWVERQLA
jgi:hypothetical protein